VSDPGRPQDLRKSPRKKTLKGGIIVFPNGISTIACKIRDQSETGVLIVIEPGSTIPDEFTLLIAGDDRKFPCNVAWRKPGRIGARFVAALTDRRHHVEPLASKPSVEPENPAESPAGQEIRSRLFKKPIRF
jgi:hypothetical protein